MYEPSSHPQRDADHESSHFFCLKLQAREKLQTFTISILPGASWNARLTFEQGELKDCKKEIMQLTCIAGIAGEAYGIHLDKEGKREHGFTVEEFAEKKDAIIATMMELKDDTGFADLEYLKSLGSTPEGGWEAYFEVVLIKVAKLWFYIHQISAAVLIHKEVNNFNFTERVGFKL